MPTLLRHTLIATAFCVTAGHSVSAQDSAASDAEVAAWIDDLGHDQYFRRESASRSLRNAGTPAVQPLVAAIRSGDLEVVERAMEVLIAIAMADSPDKDGGAWDALLAITQSGAGQAVARANDALAEIRVHRAAQARTALKAAGVFIGIDEFIVQSIGQERLIVLIDDRWNRDVESLQWLHWLTDIEHARIEGQAVTRDVLDHVIHIPDLKTIAIVDATVDKPTLEPLTKLSRIQSLEFRYVDLSDDYEDVLAAIPIRMSLELMGTGISANVVESMRNALPGLQITHRQGGFLGVQCDNTADVCEITMVIPGSAAAAAGLTSGDVIVGIGDQVIERFADLQKEINRHVPGDALAVKFLRRGQLQSVQLQLGRFEAGNRNRRFDRQPPAAIPPREIPPREIPPREIPDQPQPPPVEEAPQRFDPEQE